MPDGSEKIPGIEMGVGTVAKRKSRSIHQIGIAYQIIPRIG